MPLKPRRKKRAGFPRPGAVAATAALSLLGWMAAFSMPDPQTETAPAEFFPPLPENKRFVLIWNDEFDGERLDESKWDVPEGPRRDGRWRRDAVRLDGKGRLVMRTFRDGNDFIDGCIRTQGRFERAFGYFVIRVRLHNQPGHWPAFWLFNNSVGDLGSGGKNGAEIDVFEKPTLDDFVQHTLHWDGYGVFHKFAVRRKEIPGVMTGFHTFALLWTPKRYVFYIDGQETWRTSAGGACRVPLYLKISDEIGGWAGSIREARLPDEFLVDYVRVYDVKGKSP